mmetsp:Transcript_29906/g.58639  ORF Transcript_29906/g.58639 Transcript_29906/m.58639 type:complete len:932 (-) Transcript_29906:221-3016(-)|eukprot:CAMPEP_0175137838 /NCGR_PEP_ID=MMETSP0087-20121206/10024_1 /TAXON_ID=136419 /ORGANISM="Unknown Unknown, Strain D1" /LENGTH=931 /DNA_ID=CAMNT_0016420691 /DNA_START=27 /DNA_END=2822 /DNA_ORIENTATION=-
MKATSPYRFATCNQYKDRVMQLKSPSTPSGSCTGIAASQQYVAAGYGSGGSVVVLPLNFSEFKRSDNPPLIGAHGSALGGLAWSPFDSSLLATGAEEGVVKLWSIPSGGLAENLSSAQTAVAVGSAVRSIMWHPTAKNVAAVGTKSGLSLVNMEEGKSVNDIVLDGYGKDITSVAWNYDGSSLATCGKNGVVNVFDPRTGNADALGAGNVTIATKKPQQVFFFGGSSSAGNLGSLCIVGLNDQQKPHMWLYDSRDLTKHASSLSMASFSNGFCMPMYDFDTNLLFMTMRGSSTLQSLDVSSSPPNPLGNFVLDSGSKGCCLVPKMGCDLEKSEIQRVLSLTDKGIEQYGVCVTRKTSGFHADLYPDTADIIPATTAAEYFNGTNNFPKTVSLESKLSELVITQRPTHQRSGSTSSTVSTGSVPLARGGPASKRTLTIDEIKEAKYEESEKRKDLNSKFKVHPFKHTSGSEPRNLEQQWYKIQPSKDVYNCRNLKANNKYYAMPWKTGGGSYVHVQPLDKRGRMEDKPPGVHGHKTQVTAFDLSWLDESLLASGSQEGVVKIFRIPEGGITDDNLESIIDLQCEGRVVVCDFSKTVESLLVTSDTGKDHNVRLWDIEHGAEGYCGFDLHSAIIQDVALDFRSQLFATASKDGYSKVVDPRDGSLPYVRSFECDNCSKDPQVVWVADDKIIVLGANKMAKRSLDLYDIGTGKKLASHPCGMDSSTMLPHYDRSSNLLFLGHFGGRIIEIFTINSSAPFIEQLNKYQSTDCTGLAFLPNTDIDVKNVEVAKCLKLSRETILPLSWKVPRKRLEYFQDDIYGGEFFETKAVCSASAWFNGELKEGGLPPLRNINPGMELLSEAPEEEVTERQMRYKAQLLAEKEPEITNYMGHKTTEEVNQHFIEKAKDMPTRNRWDAAPVAGNEVDSDEWDDSD